MRTVPSLDRIITGFCLLLILGSALVALRPMRSPSPSVRAQLTPSCGNGTSAETYGLCTTTADCTVGACIAGTCTEQCDGGSCCSNACRYKTADTICRNKAGPCDSPERCSGIAASCPEDVMFSSGTICRPSGGVCDSPERCDGVTVACPENILIYNAICRQASNACDLPEICNGAQVQCPTDTFQPQGMSCGDSSPCSAPMCDGRGRCSTVKTPDGTPCLTAAGVAGICGNAVCVPQSSASSATLSSSISSSVASSALSVTSVSSAAVSFSSLTLLPKLPTAEPVCGNRIVELDEQCEDGNVRDDDGCSSQCLFEPLYCCQSGARVPVPSASRQNFPTLTAGSLCTDFDPKYDAAVEASRSFSASCPCGDGFLNPGEACDGDAFAPLPNGDQPTCSALITWTIGELSCTPQCTIDTSDCEVTICGDGRLGPGEDCDEGGGDTPTCDDDCSYVQCGDGLVNRAAGEECDDAWENVDGVAGACRTNCLYAICGDGLADSGEECDDGNLENGDGCNMVCRLEPIYCCEAGQRRVVKSSIREANPDEAVPGGSCPALDAAFDINSTVSLSDDALCACGDGFLQLQEWCDGDLFSMNEAGDSLKECANVPWLGPKYLGEVRCAPDCTIDDRSCRPAICGDGRLDSGEECDGELFAPNASGQVPATCADVRGESYDGSISCTADCHLDTTACRSSVCGDGQVDPGEECDDAGSTADCDPDCTVAECGDGVLNKNAGEDCDDGGRNDDYVGGACRTNCLPAHCGDQVLDPGEECDDGNEVDGDGCSPACQKEGIRQCNASICEGCGGAFFCSRAACQRLGCRPGPADGVGSIFAALGNPLGLESYTCIVEPECSRR